MEYRIELPAALPDFAVLCDLLHGEDPAAVAELDVANRVWRVSTLLGAQDLLGLLAHVGSPVAAARVRLLPSVCCGGCSG